MAHTPLLPQTLSRNYNKLVVLCGVLTAGTRGTD